MTRNYLCSFNNLKTINSSFISELNFVTAIIVLHEFYSFSLLLPSYCSPREGINCSLHLLLLLNYCWWTSAYVKETGSQKHLGLILDTQLYFEERRKTLFTKVTGTIRLIRNFGTLYRDQLCKLSTNFLSDPFWTREILHMIIHSIIGSKTK